MGGILLHLMEVGAEQHQRGGQGRAAAEGDGRAPGHTGACSFRRGSQRQQTGGGGQRSEGEPAERLPQAAVAQAQRRPLIGVADAAAGQHQRQHQGRAAQRHQRHQRQAQQQRRVGQQRHPIAPAGEIHQRMGLAVGVDPRVGIKYIIGQVLPGQQQHRRQQEQQQLIRAHRLALAQPPAGRQQHRHHRHRIHRPLDGRLPQPAPSSAIGVKACDDLRLGCGQRQLAARGGPYI